MIIDGGSPMQRAKPIGIAIAVLAKEPVPGRVKTRLCPPYSITEAAILAAAALEDTLDAVVAATVAHRLLVLDGNPSAWQRQGVQVLPQRGSGLGERLDNALSDTVRTTGCPVLLIGMDTPQVLPGQLEAAAAALSSADSVLGLASDGGFWAIGVRDAQPGLCAGVPMSRPDTGHLQSDRMAELWLHPTLLDQLTDVDDATSAAEVARLAPGSRFAALLEALASAA
jgi:rSAM/selenodomain-associated transferase 1